MVTTSERYLEAVDDVILPEMPPVDLPEEDGIPLETDWHRIEIGLLVDLVRTMWHDRTDYFVGGNMFIYYSVESVELARKKEWRGPDFFVATGVDGGPERRVWATWLENGHAPDVIIELLSPSTKSVDLGTKKRIYERDLRVPEYVAYDHDSAMLLGWRAVNGVYEPITPSEHGRIWLNSLQVWVGTWVGPYQGVVRRWLRFWDNEGRLIPTEAERNDARAEVERQRAEAEHLRAETAEQRAQAERERSEHLLALLRANGIDPDSTP